MSPSLDGLPDLCLLAVFQYFSLHELLGTIRLVSTRWSSLLPTELNRRRSLVIVDDRTFDLSRLQLDQYGSRLIEHVRRDDALTPWARLPHIDPRNVINRNNRYPDYEEGVFILHDQVPLEMITTLLDNLARITSLTVVQQLLHLSSLDQIVRMIDHWRLVSLKLNLNFTTIVETYRDGYLNHQNNRIVALFNSINRAESLKHLTLKFEFFRNDPINLPALTILSQLSTFHAESFVFEDYYLGDALVQYASDNRDLKVGTNDCSFLLETLLGINEKSVCDKFANVQLDFRGFQEVTIDSLDRFCTRFSSLVYLSLLAPSRSIIEMATKSLSKLTQLVHLSLSIFTPFEANRIELEFAPDQINPVPSVRLLTLALCIRFHSYFEQLRLPEVFPNVQVLGITNQTEQCPDCGFNTFRMHGRYHEIAPQMRQCAQLARRPFRRFPRLHTIEIDANDSVLLSRPEGSLHVEKRFITRDEL